MCAVGAVHLHVLFVTNSSLASASSQPSRHTHTARIVDRCSLDMRAGYLKLITSRWLRPLYPGLAAEKVDD